jgi:hypothetical protein
MKLPIVSTLVACLLTLAVAPVARADHNDLFANAIPLAIGDDNTETTVGLDIEPNEWMTNETIGYCQGASTSTDAAATAWHEVIGNGRRLTVWAHSPQHGVIVTVYNTVDFGQLSRNRIGCNYDQTFTRQAVPLSWDSAPGVRYRIQVGRCRELNAQQSGPANPNRCGVDPGTLHVWLRSDPAGNDNSAAPAALPAAGGEYDNVGATNPNENPSCNGQAYGRNVWFAWQAPAKGEIAFQATTRTVNHNPMFVSVYAGGTKLGCGEGRVGGIQVQAGATYLVEVGGRGSGTAAEESRFALEPQFAQDFDVDDDKIPGPPVGSDCDDGNAAIHPGARDKPENGVDEDCARGDARYPRLGVSPRMVFLPVAGGLRIRELGLRTVPRGARVVLRCRRGPGCVRGKRVVTRRTRKKLRTLSVGTRGYGVLRAGSVVEVDVTKKGTVGRRFRWKVQSSGAPRFVEYCLHPRRGKFRC